MLHEVLAEIANQRGYDSANGPEPVVSLEMFFDGNNDIGSIGCKLTEHPGPERFYATLRTTRDRADVLDVWVGISEVMDGTRRPVVDIDGRLGRGHRSRTCWPAPSIGTLRRWQCRSSVGRCTGSRPSS